MNIDEELRAKLVTRYTWLAVTAAFLLALFWSLGKFFFWIFFGALIYFVFLILYYRPRTKKPIFDFSFGRDREERRSPDQASTGQKPGTKVNPKTLKLIMFFAISSVIFVYILITFISFVNNQVSSVEQVGDPVQMEEQRSSVAMNPNDVDALTNLGNSFYAASQYDSAFKYYNRVLEIDPKNYSGLFNAGLVYFQWADYPKSIELFSKCNSLYPESMEVHNMLGDCYYSQNNYNEAIRWYQQAYDKGTRNSAQLNIMAYIYDTQNRTGDAIKYYKEALEQDSSLVDIYTRLAELEPSRAEWYNKKAATWK